MSEIAAIKPNGLVAASTFSGCGGSSLGYRMAGFKVGWASEFIESARETYAANSSDTIIDDRDIREVRGSDILEALDLEVGELDLFDGSPPCSAFSPAGKREKLWGTKKKYSETTQRVDDLFDEFVRLIDELRPKTFVAENTAGIASGRAAGFLSQVLESLRAIGYEVECRILDSRWLGVPQMRRRAIIIGVRSDLGRQPAFPAPLPYAYTIRDALPKIDVRDAYPVEPETLLYKGRETETGGYAVGREWGRLRVGGQSTKYFQAIRCHPDRPANTITQTGASSSAAGPLHPYFCRKFSLFELRRLSGFPDDFVLTGTFAQAAERIGRAVPPVMMSHIARSIATEVFDV